MKRAAVILVAAVLIILEGSERAARKAKLSALSEDLKLTQQALNEQIKALRIHNQLLRSHQERLDRLESHRTQRAMN